MKIQIESKPSDTINYYNGTYIEDIKDELLEHRKEIYEFTIVECNDFIDVTWNGYTPDNYEELKELIIKQFQQNL